MPETVPSYTASARPPVLPPSGAATAPLPEPTIKPKVNGEDLRPTRLPTPSWAVLLQRFYARRGLPLPRIEPLKPEGVPPPYHKLLVHSADLTPTLERFYERRLGLTVLRRETEGEEYLREVVLKLADGGQFVSYGVIRICLGHLPGPARERVLQEQRPMGNILRSEGIPHLSWPQAFFRIHSDSHISLLLGLPQVCALYGRRNVLLDGARRLLAEVIEILAPVEPDQPGAGSVK
jgi:chorismate-pyruvate lyase